MITQYSIKLFVLVLWFHMSSHLLPSHSPQISPINLFLILMLSLNFHPSLITSILLLIFISLNNSFWTSWRLLLIRIIVIRMFLIITINFLIHLLFLTIFFSIIDRCKYTLLNGEGGIVKLRIAFLFDKCVIILTICTKINLSTYIIKFTNILLFYYPIRLLLSHYHPTLNYLILPLELFFLILPIMMLKIGSFLIKIFIFVFGNDPR